MLFRKLATGKLKTFWKQQDSFCFFSKKLPPPLPNSRNRQKSGNQGGQTAPKWLDNTVKPCPKLVGEITDFRRYNKEKRLGHLFHHSLMEVTTRFELVNEGFADLCLTTWPRHHISENWCLPIFTVFWSGRRGSNSLPPPWQGGALPDELRPQDVYSLRRIHKKWCLRSESNQWHGDFQSPALPTELQRQMATRIRLELTTSSVTG